jgi:four helix bundle protein
LLIILYKLLYINNIISDIKYFWVIPGISVRLSRLIDKLSNMATGVENLEVFKCAFWLAMNIFEKSKDFPKDEKYALTDQIRRSSRAVTANLAEAFEKRRYEAHFISKLTDAAMENKETQIWFKFAL